MSYVAAIPRHVPKEMLPGLKVGGLVKTKIADYSQEKGGFTTKPLPAGVVGRVKRIFDFGSRAKLADRRFYCFIKFEGHPLTAFHPEELVKVKV